MEREAMFWDINTAPKALAMLLSDAEVAPPFSPSLYENLASCGRRVAFEKGRKVPGFTHPKARLGTAFHIMLEQVQNPPLDRIGLPPRAFRQWAQDVFIAEADKQRQKAACLPRERYWKWPEDLQQRFAIEATLVAQKLRPMPPTHEPSAHAALKVEATDTATELIMLPETRLVSRDGLLCGTPDRIHRTPTGTEIVDYKTGDLGDPKKIARYRRQAHLYAVLIQESESIWPTHFRLENPITGQKIAEDVDIEAAHNIADTIRATVRAHFGKKWCDLPAAPGADCDYCPYRAYCSEYWAVNSSPQIEEGERCDVEGILLQVHWPASGEEGYLELQIDPRSSRVLSVAFQAAAFAHLRTVPVGSPIRLLNALATDADLDHLRLTPSSEAYILMRR